MCGICGVWNFANGDAVTTEDIDRMRDTLRHRGPDDCGTWVDAERGIGLGFRRLSIIDLSDAGRQPMPNEDGSLWVVFNGEIYNYQALRAELEREGHRFRSRTDTETVLHGYEQWGTAVLSRLRGMFAFAIWDGPARRLVLARDRIGIKPLYYSVDARGITFASELRAVLARGGIDRTLDKDALYDYLSCNYVPAPLTAYARIRKLPPAHLLVLEHGVLSVSEYWDLRLSPDDRTSEVEAIARVQEGLRDAVRSHLVADVPLGLFLSGGVDSSIVAVLMAEAQSKPVNTFTIGFDLHERSELPFARIVADRIHSAHHERVLTWPEARDGLALVAATYDEPFADSSSVPTIALARLAAERVKVALSGEGGDETFAGYDAYQAWTMQQRWGRRVPLPARQVLGWLGRRWPLSRGQRIAMFLASGGRAPLEQYARLMEWISLEEKRRIVPDERLAALGDHDDRWYLRRFWREDADSITRVQYLDLKSYLPDDLLVKVDRASMAVSLEARVPFLDHVLVETLFRIPGYLRFKGGRTKYLERAAMKDHLPAETLSRPKMGFTPPLERWLPRAESDWAADMLRRGAAVELGLLRPDAIDRLSPRPAWLWAPKVWVLLALEVWARRECGWPVDPWTKGPA